MQRGRILFSCMALVALSLPALAAPDEDLLGKAAGYPIGTRANWFYEENVRVGSFSNLDRYASPLYADKIGHAAAASRSAR